MAKSGLVYGAMHVSGLWYVGSTIQPFKYRVQQHLAKAAICPVTTFHIALSETHAHDWVWVVLDSFRLITICELHHRETQYMLALDSVGSRGFNQKYGIARPYDCFHELDVMID